MNEVKRRLYEAYQKDPFIKDIKERANTYLKYNSMPYTGGEYIVPEYLKVCQESIKRYTESEYSFLTAKTDLAVAMSWSLTASYEQKILSTKYKSNLTVLQGIDERLSLYTEYLKDWLRYTDFSPKPVLSSFDSYFYKYPEPYKTFEQWLYTGGYEYLLTDREFLNVVYSLR